MDCSLLRCHLLQDIATFVISNPHLVSNIHTLAWAVQVAALTWDFIRQPDCPMSFVSDGFLSMTVSLMRTPYSSPR